MTSTCLRIMSMVCMMQRGRRPWFLAKIIACSRVTFRVHLQRTKKQKVNAVRTMSVHAILTKRCSYNVEVGFFLVRVITITLC